MGGGGESAHTFIEQLRPNVDANKKVIVIFDRDEEGGKGIKACINTGNDRAQHLGVYKKDNWHYFMLPKTAEHTYIDFMIEDYFSKTYKASIINAKIAEAEGQMNAYKKEYPKDFLKASLAAKDRFDAYTKDNLAGFKILLDRINGTATDIKEV